MKIPHSIQGRLTQFQTFCVLDYKKLQRAYKIFASNGILFNHESERRGETLLPKN